MEVIHVFVGACSHWCFSCNVLWSPPRATSYSLQFLFQHEVQMCLSAQTTAEQWSIAPTWSSSPTAVVHTLWLSTGGEIPPVRSADAFSSTEPYSSCVCQPEQHIKKEHQEQFEGIWAESPRCLINVVKISNNLLMIHIRNHSMILICKFEQKTNITIVETLIRSHPFENEYQLEFHVWPHW